MEVDLVELLRDKATLKGWGFDYGRKDHHNLSDITLEDGYEPTQWQLFLDPVLVDESREDFVTHSGYFMLLSVSDLDQVYDGQKSQEVNNGKYRTNIKPKKEYMNKFFKAEIECLGNMEVTKLVVTEVINIFDNNLDGILINFSINQFR
jgi:hypothetical protein